MALGADDLVAEALPVAADGEAVDALAVALNSPVARPAARPSNPSRAPNGNGGEEAAGPGKRRDRLPIIITAAAFGLLIIVTVVVIAVTGNDAATKSSRPAGQESGQAVRPAAKTPARTAPRGSYGGNADLFPNVRGNRTKKDYEEEQRRNRQGGQ
ncbi:MAG: hypothetical protein GWP05_02485 [Anaerolineaceae bacterium]|nr:hypothetical protein [Anaerolineaceae bacterium]